MTNAELQIAIDAIRNATADGSVTNVMEADIMDALKSNNIPLSGTTNGNPVTGVVEMGEDSQFKRTNTDGAGFKIGNISDGCFIEFTVDGRAIVNDVGSVNAGFEGLSDFSESEPTNKLIYAQRSYVDKANSYSTNETLTGGTWINDKPIYRKVYTGITNSNGAFAISTVGLNIESIVSINSITNDGDSFYPTNYIEYQTGGLANVFSQIKVSIIDNEVSSNSYSIMPLNISTPIIGANCNIVLEYTKTTD